MKTMKKWNNWIEADNPKKKSDAIKNVHLYQMQETVAFIRGR